MPLVIKNAPQDNFDTFIKDVHDAAIDIENPQIGDDHDHHMTFRLFHLSMDSVISGEGLRAAEMKGWRYLFNDEGVFVDNPSLNRTSALIEKDCLTPAKPQKTQNNAS